MLGEYNKNSAEPVRKLIEVQREHAFHGAHLQAHHDGLPPATSRTCPTSSSTRRRSSTAGTGRRTPRSSWPATSRPSRCFPWSRSTGAAGSAGSYHGRRSRPSRRRRGRSTRTCRGRRPRCPGSRPPSTAPRSRRPAKDFAAVDLLLDLTFGPTSDLYKRLVEEEQKVDQLFPYLPANADPVPRSPSGARVKKAEDALYVRDALLKAFAAVARRTRSPRSAWRTRSPTPATRSSAPWTTPKRSPRPWPASCATSARSTRSTTIYRVYESLTPADLQAAARKYFTDDRLVVTTLSHDAAAGGDRQRARRWPRSLRRPAGARTRARRSIRVAIPLPQLNVKLLFRAGSAHDPRARRAWPRCRGDDRRGGLAGAAHRRDPAGALPHGGQLRGPGGQGDDHLHRQRAPRQLGRASPRSSCPCSSTPATGRRTSAASRTPSSTRSTVDLRSNNEEELAKERLQADVFAGTPYAHPVLGTVAGSRRSRSPTCRTSCGAPTPRGALTIGLSGDVPADFVAAPPARAGAAARGAGAARARRRGRRASRGAWRSTSSRRTRAPPPSPSGIPSR